MDGSSLKSAAYPEDPASYRPGTPRQHGWNLWHMNALFDLENGIYTDLIVQKEHEKNESSALCQMTDRSRVSGKVILLADRNYESCNNLAHLEKRNWNYLIRIRDKARGIAYGMPLPDQPEFDIPLMLALRNPVTFCHFFLRGQLNDIAQLETHFQPILGAKIMLNRRLIVIIDGRWRVV